MKALATQSGLHVNLGNYRVADERASPWLDYDKQA
jgi:hypothetical protein